MPHTTGRSFRSSFVLALPLVLSCSSHAPGTVAIATPAPETAPASSTPKPPPASLADVVAQAAPVPKDATEPEREAETNERGWLGVELEPAGPGESGVRVGRIVPKSPAAKGGLLAGDLIQRLDNEIVAQPADVVRLVGGRHAGGRLAVMLFRQGADRLLSVTLGAAPEQDEIYRMSFVDQPAPAFELLQTVQGTFTPTIQAQRGQVLVVEFWAPWCVACRALIPHMTQWHAQYAARGLRVVGITTDPVPRAASAARQLGLEYPVASDTSGKTMMAYQARAIPAVFVIDRAGTVRDVMVGFDAERLPKLDALVDRLVAER
jgi:peroxiredoxin